MNDQLESLKEYCKEGERVCPTPQAWNELWEMLPNRSRVGSGWEPPLPLILGAWWHTSNLDKMLRLRQHLAWAAEHGSLPEIDVFLRSLEESSWHHLTD